jgi:hypothetical protein
MARKRKPSGRKSSGKGKMPGRRKMNARPLRPRFLIVCEGEKTEPNYFRSFRVTADVKVVGTGRGTTNVVKEAEEISVAATRRGEKYTRVWVVFDRDEFSATDFNAAIEQAKNAGFSVAYSNEAFELWYLLHFDYVNTGISRRQYQHKLSGKLARPYKKNDPTLYLELFNRQEQAIRNAKKLLSSYSPHNPARDNPCTTVHKLVQELNKFTR